MTARNSEEFLPDTLEALRRQSFEDFEVVVADCASTDRTQEIAAGYAARDARFRVERSDVYLGMYENHNRVVAVARGRLFVWLASDDVPAPDFLSACVAALEADEGLVLVAPTTAAIDAAWRIDAPTPFLAYRDDRLRLDLPGVGRRAAHLLVHLRECNAFSSVWRIEVLRDTRLAGHYPGADRVVLMEGILRGRGRQLPEVLLYRRVHDGQVHRLLRRDADRVFNRRLGRTARIETLNTFFQSLAAIRQAPLPLRARLAAGLSVSTAWLVYRVPRKVASRLRRRLARLARAVT